MVRSITPRGVGRPDGERHVHRSAVPSPIKELTEPFSITGKLILSATSGQVFWFFKPSVLLGSENLLLTIRRFVVSLPSNILIRAVLSNQTTGERVVDRYGYGCVDVDLYPGIKVRATDYIFAACYREAETTNEYEVSFNICGIKRVIG